MTTKILTGYELAMAARPLTAEEGSLWDTAMESAARSPEQQVIFALSAQVARLRQELSMVQSYAIDERQPLRQIELDSIAEVLETTRGPDSPAEPEDAGP